MTRQYNHQLKLERAAQHLHSLEIEVQRWAGTHPYTVAHEFDPERGQNILRVYAHSQPPVKLSLIISDCVHSLRSALDNLAYELAEAHTGKPLPSQIAEKSEFPIYKGRDGFEGNRKKKIGGIAPRAQAIIQRLQPYERGDYFESDPLWVLYNLSNIDKHRRLHLVMLAIPTSKVGGSNVRISQALSFDDTPIEHSAELASYTPVNPSRKMEMQFRLEISVAFCEGPAYAEAVVGTLSKIRDYILTRVIPPLRPFLLQKP